MQTQDLGEIEARVASLRAGAELTEDTAAERDRIIDQLLQKARWFDEVIDNAPFAIHRKSPDGGYLWASRAHAEIFGAPVEGNVGATSTGALDQSASPDRQAKMREEVVGNRVYSRLECPLVGEDGKAIGSIGFDTDITELKRAAAQPEDLVVKREEAVDSQISDRRRDAERFRDFAETSSDWFWETDADLRFNWLSDRYSEITGLATEDILGKSRAESFPDAVSGNPSVWMEHRRKLEAREPFRDFEFAWTSADGSRVVGRTNGVPYYDEAGKFKGYRGTGINITAQQRAEDDLRLRNRALESLREGVIITDAQQPDNPIIYVNPAFTTLTGYSQEEVLGRNCRFLQGEDRDELARQTLRAAIEDGRSIQTVVRNYRKDGSQFANDLRLAPVRDDAGRVTQFVGIQSDITRRDEAERSLRASEERLAEAQQIGRIGHWWLDIDAGQLHWSDELFRIFGWDPVAGGLPPKRFYDSVYPDDRDLIMEIRDLVLSGAGPQRAEYRITRPDGEVRWISQEMILEADQGGQPLRIKGVAQDVSERKRAELALLASEQRFRDFASSSADWFWETDAANNYTWLSRTGEGQFGQSLGWYQGKSRLAMRGDVENDVHWTEHLRTVEAHEPFRDLVTLTTIESGEKLWTRANGVPIFDDDGSFLGYRGTPRNIHQEIEARSAAERLVQALDSLTEGVALFDSNDRLVINNRMHRKYTPGFADGAAWTPTYEELLQALIDDGIVPVDGETAEDWLARRMAWHRDPDGSFAMQRADGLFFDIVERRLDDGGTIFVARDITQQELAVRALADSEQRFRDFVDAGSDRFWETDAQHRFTYVGGGDQESAFWSGRETMGKHPWEAAGGDPEGDNIWREVKRLHETHQAFRDVQLTVVWPDGTVRHLRINGKPIFDEAGQFRGHRGTSTDITDDVLARREAERAAEVLIGAIEIIPTAVTYFDAQGRLVYMNAHFRELAGNRSVDELKGMTFNELVRARVDEGLQLDAVGQERQWLQARTAYHRNPHGTFRLHYDVNGGRSYDLHEQRTPDGGTLGIYWDVTDTMEQEELLQRAQRMEAMGTLVGGLAHEMNNLLQPICGLADVALRDPSNPETVELALQGIMRSSTEANQLLQGLLAFGRREQASKESTDLNDALRDALRIIGPALPPTIQIDTRVEPGVGRAWISGTEFVQVVMNLAKNASDAMNGNGAITISLQQRDPPTDNPDQAFPAQRHAVLSVTDQGPGLPEDKLHRIFEPFYTSKDVGEGTGLGLSVVYNIVNDWRGAIRAENAAAGGADFEVAIPLIAEEGD